MRRERAAICIRTVIARDIDDIANASAAHPHQVRQSTFPTPSSSTSTSTSAAQATRPTNGISLPMDDKEVNLHQFGGCDLRSPTATDDGNSSVQRLLVLTSDYPGDYPGVGVSTARIRARIQALGLQIATWPARTTKWARMAASDVITRGHIWRETYQLPYLILTLGVLQVALQAPLLRPLSSDLMWAGRSAGVAQPWRFVSYVLPHTGTTHLALNVVVQTLVGIPAEAAQGTLRVAAVYAGGALSGALATAVVCPTLQVAGASAAIYALLTSHLADVFLNREWISHPGARAGAVILLAVADAAYTVHHAVLYGNLRPRIGLAAHAAGAIFGLPLGLTLYRRGPMKPLSLLPGLAMTSIPSASRERVILAARVISALLLGTSAAAGIAFLVTVPNPAGQGFDVCCA